MGEDSQSGSQILQGQRRRNERTRKGNGHIPFRPPRVLSQNDGLAMGDTNLELYTELDYIFKTKGYQKTMRFAKDTMKEHEWKI